MEQWKQWRRQIWLTWLKLCVSLWPCHRIKIESHDVLFIIAREPWKGDEYERVGRALSDIRALSGLKVIVLNFDAFLIAVTPPK